MDLFAAGVGNGTTHENELAQKWHKNGTEMPMTRKMICAILITSKIISWIPNRQIDGNKEICYTVFISIKSFKRNLQYQAYGKCQLAQMCWLALFYFLISACVTGWNKFHKTLDERMRDSEKLILVLNIRGCFRCLE